MQNELFVSPGGSGLKLQAVYWRKMCCSVWAWHGWVGAVVSRPVLATTQGGSVPGLCPTDRGRRTCGMRIQQNLNKDNLDMIFGKAGKA